MESDFKVFNSLDSMDSIDSKNYSPISVGTFLLTHYGGDTVKPASLEYPLSPITLYALTR